jgi:copper chaperone
MKKIISIAALSALLIVMLQLAGCGSSNQEEAMSQQKTQPAADVANAKTVTLKVSGMSCMGCVNTIDNALAETDGVITKTVSLEDSAAVVKFDPAKTDESKLVLAIQDAGYDAQVSN